MDPAGSNFLDTFNVIGFVLAIVANIIIGFLWYAAFTPTGRIWMRHQGLDPNNLPKVPGGQMAVSMVLMVIGAVLMMFVFTHTNGIYLDAFRNTDSGGTAGYHLSVMDGITGGFFTWLGFIVPIHLSQVAFERKPWSLFAVNVGYYLVTLVLAGVLIATVGAK